MGETDLIMNSEKDSLIKYKHKLRPKGCIGVSKAEVNEAENDMQVSRGD